LESLRGLRLLHDQSGQPLGAAGACPSRYGLRTRHRPAARATPACNPATIAPTWPRRRSRSSWTSWPGAASTCAAPAPPRRPAGGGDRSCFVIRVAACPEAPPRHRTQWWSGARRRWARPRTIASNHRRIH